MSHDVLVFLSVFVVSYLWHGFGICVGYHRLLTHRSFSCPKFVEYFWAAAGYLAFQGSPMWWVTMHRAHHRYQDTELDPHSPRNGILHAHFGWIMQKRYPSHINPALQTKDMMDDPVYKFLDRNGDWHKAYMLLLAINVAFRLVILAIWGWIPALASILAGFIILQIPLVLNVACHIPAMGYKTYNTRDDSVNVWWVSLFGFGEGWHNNHHASPHSARTGMELHELDPSWACILLMKRLGLVTRITEVTPEQLATMESARKKRAIPAQQTTVIDRTPQLDFPGNDYAGEFATQTAAVQPSHHNVRGGRHRTRSRVTTR
jgi:fatty-acid desaturase